MGIYGKQQGDIKKKRRLKDILFDVRPEEVLTVTRFSQRAVVANVFNAVLVAFCIWSDQQANLILTWLVVSNILFLLVLFRSIRAQREMTDEVLVSDVWETVFYTVLTALPWPILAYITLGHDDLLVSVFVLLISVGMAAGGTVVTYRMPIAAMSYLITILAGSVLTITLTAHSELWLMNVFMVSFFLMMTSTVFNAWAIARKREDGLKSAYSQNMELKMANDEIRRLSELDVLTGLYNRKAFVEKLVQKTQQQDNPQFSVFLMDLDRFKHINDSLGHGAGDELLKVVAKRLRNAVSDSDVIARFGGDEFALIVGKAERPDIAMRVADRILDRLNRPVTIEGSVLHPNASVGISFYPEHSEDPEELVSISDIALHHAKENGRGRYELYDHEMAVSLARDDEIERTLRSALDKKMLQIFYQPKFNLRTEDIIGAEALLRCYQEDGELISTELLLDVAEERGLIPQISSYIFERVTSDILKWREEDIYSVPVSINIHAFELKTPELLLAELRKMLEVGIDQSDILLEVTEGCFVGRGSDAASATLDMIDEMGVRLSLDDFGTGHAALSHLKRLPVSELKVDREFIRGVVSDDRDRAITVAALEITRCLKVDCVAEGIETREQLDFLKELNTEGMSIIGQGHYWAEAMKVDKFIEYVLQYRKVRGSKVVSLGESA